MLSQFSLLSLPPSISLNNGSQEIVIPVQGSKDWCMMELNRFVAGYEGLSELSLKDGEGEGVLEGVIEGFLLDQSQSEFYQNLLFLLSNVPIERILIDLRMKKQKEKGKD